MTICIFPTVSVMMPLYVRDVLHLGPDKLGFIMAASGVGLGLRRDHSHPDSARASRLTGMMRRPVAVVVARSLRLSRVQGFRCAAGSLVVTSLGLVPHLRPLQHHRAGTRALTLRGRVSAVMGLSFFGLLPVAGLGVTSLADAIGMRTALALVGDLLWRSASLAILSWIGARLNEAPPSAPAPAAVPPEVGSGLACSLGAKMISFSTCWNSSRHTAGDAMLREIKDKLGFELHRARARHPHFAHAGHPKNVRARARCASAACTISVRSRWK